MYFTLNLTKLCVLKQNNAEETATNVSNGIVEKLIYNKLNIREKKMLNAALMRITWSGQTIPATP